MGKVNNIECKQNGNSKNQKEMLQNKNTVAERKNAFKGLIIHRAKERIHELEGRSTETPYAEMQRGKKP